MPETIQTEGTPKSLRIDMTSDVICPWCWLGLKYLDAALALCPDIDADVHFRPFQLDPAMPPEGKERGPYMRAKFGGPDGKPRPEARQMNTFLLEEGEKVGINFRFDNIEQVPNTLKAHALLRWAQAAGKGREVKEAIFRAYFEDCRDVGDAGVLADIAAAAGLDRDDVAAKLSAGADLDAVQGEALAARGFGISGVPAFILGGQQIVLGAQPAEKLAKALRASV